MVVVVIGLGSMGRRRIRLLKRITNDIILGVDNSSERCEQAEKEFEITTFNSLEQLFENEKPECAVVSSSPISHAFIIEECLKNNCHVFSEINLVKDKYLSNMKLASEKKRVLFLSSTFLYREEIQYIKNKVNQYNKRVNYTYHVGQYLPDWHPWESIHDFFVGNKKTNGCRELFAIEFPWIMKTFGEIDSYRVYSDKNTDLPIDYNDNYILMVKHRNGNKGLLSIDVVSRKAVRNLEIYGENIYLTWDGSPSGLKEYNFTDKYEETIDLYSSVDKQEGYASFIIENAYQKELESFFDEIRGLAKAEYTYEEDYKLLDLIDKIESGIEL